MSLGDLSLLNQNLTVIINGGVATVGSLVKAKNNPDIPENRWIVKSINQVSNGYVSKGKSVILTGPCGKFGMAEGLTLIVT